MNTQPVTITPEIDLETMVEDFVLARNARGLPVIEDGKLAGHCDGD